MCDALSTLFDVCIMTILSACRPILMRFSTDCDDCLLVYLYIGGCCFSSEIFVVRLSLPMAVAQHRPTNSQPDKPYRRHRKRAKFEVI